MRYAIHTARPGLFNAALRYSSDGRRYREMRQAADAVENESFENGRVFIHDTEESGHFKWFEVKRFGVLNSREITSLDDCPFDHPPVTEAYFVHQDSAYSVKGRKGISFHVMYGNPWDAYGTHQDEFDTLAEAVAYMRHHSGDAPIFRVLLERFDGEHSVKEIKS